MLASDGSREPLQALIGELRRATNWPDVPLAGNGYSAVGVALSLFMVAVFAPAAIALVERQTPMKIFRTGRTE